MTLHSVSPQQTLRMRAEGRVHAYGDEAAHNANALSLEAMQNMVHELHVHQIELEMQNDELLQTQLQLDAARSRYFDLYDMAPVGYCTVSEHGLIIESNFTATSMLGVMRSDLVKQPVSRFIVKGFEDIFFRCRNALFATGAAQRFELQMVRPGAEPLWVHVQAVAARDANGEPVQRMVLSDMTERKRLEDALKQKNIELEVARAVAEKASRAKSDFLSNMTHELRSPLNAILGFAQLLEMGNPPPSVTQKSSVDHILRAGWYLLDLVGEILDLTSIESGKLTLALGPVSVQEVLQESCASVEAAASERHIVVRVAPLPRPFVVDCDHARIKQIMGHLLSNAIQFNRPGGSVEVDCSQISSTRLRIAVRDTGEGLNKEKIAQLFQPFNRLGHENNAQEGTGVGLALSKRLVEMMGGAIGVQSTVGVGSVFWIEANLFQDPSPSATNAISADDAT